MLVLFGVGTGSVIVMAAMTGLIVLEKKSAGSQWVRCGAGGILLLLAIRDRRQRAEVGYGLEPIITDGYAGSVLRGIRPILRQGNYGGALLAAAEQFGSHIAEAKGVDLGGNAERRGIQ